MAEEVRVRRTKSEAEELCRLWNETHSVGDCVRYTPAGWGDTALERTRTIAVVIAQTSAVVWITNHICAIAIDWLQPPPIMRRRRWANKHDPRRAALGLIRHGLVATRDSHMGAEHGTLATCQPFQLELPLSALTLQTKSSRDFATALPQ